MRQPTLTESAETILQGIARDLVEGIEVAGNGASIMEANEPKPQRELVPPPDSEVVIYAKRREGNHAVALTIDNRAKLDQAEMAGVLCVTGHALSSLVDSGQAGAADELEALRLGVVASIGRMVDLYREIAMPNCADQARVARAFLASLAPNHAGAPTSPTWCLPVPAGVGVAELAVALRTVAGMAESMNRDANQGHSAYPIVAASVALTRKLADQAAPLATAGERRPKAHPGRN